MTQILPKGDSAKFIARGPDYKQTCCYAAWMASVLDRLYAKPPISAKDLVECSADYMKGGSDLGLRDQIRSTGIRKCADLRIPGKNLFGPIDEPNYGSIDINRGTCETFSTERNYYKTIARNYPQEAKENNDCLDFKTRIFSYPVPGTHRSIELMRLGLVSDLLGGGPGKTENDTLMFRHPAFTPEKYADFMACLEPLFAIVHDPKTSQEQKENAVISFFWLMAQATPAFRGGTAHSRVALEYLATQAGIKVPYAKEGFDLWAEAASTDIERFKQNYRSGIFFDHEITDKQIYQWQDEQLRRQAATPSTLKTNAR